MGDHQTWRLEIEDCDKQQKLANLEHTEEPMHLFFGVYCSQAGHLQNHREIKVRICPE